MHNGRRRIVAAVIGSLLDYRALDQLRGRCGGSATLDQNFAQYCFPQNLPDTIGKQHEAIVGQQLIRDTFDYKMLVQPHRTAQDTAHVPPWPDVVGCQAL